MDHDQRITHLDTVYVYHYGTKFLVEVHIVLDEDMSLRVAHDISESLQINIESLPDVIFTSVTRILIFFRWKEHLCTLITSTNTNLKMNIKLYNVSPQSLFLVIILYILALIFSELSELV